MFVHLCSESQALFCCARRGPCWNIQTRDHWSRVYRCQWPNDTERAHVCWVSDWFLNKLLLITASHTDARTGWYGNANSLWWISFHSLRERTHGCVQNFIANCVEMLKNDTSGQLTDSCSTSQATNNDMHIQLEMDMLKEILSTPSSNSKDVLWSGTQLVI